MGLADSAAHGTVGVVTLLGLFARALREPVSVECEGASSAAMDAVLDALPSAEMRQRVRDALAADLRVHVAYEVTKATITVYEPDGTGKAVAFSWGQ